MAALEESGCPCMDEEQRVFIGVDPRPCEFKLPTAGNVEWLLFSYT